MRHISSNIFFVLTSKCKETEKQIVFNIIAIAAIMFPLNVLIGIVSLKWCMIWHHSHLNLVDINSTLYKTPLFSVWEPKNWEPQDSKLI